MKKDRFVKIWIWVGLIFLFIFVLFPFYWMFVTSIKPDSEILSSQPTLWPQKIIFKHYQKAWVYGKIGKYFKNSIIIASMTVVLSLLAVVPAAYASIIYRSQVMNIISSFILFLQMFPGILLLIPLYILMKNYQLIDTYTALVISYSTFTIPFCYLLTKSYFEGIPRELFEAARIDGCSDNGIFVKIALPLILPGIMVIGLFSFVLAWCDFMFANTFSNSEATRTITVGVSTLQGVWTVEWGPLMAAASIATIPILIIFSFANKYIIEGLTAGAVKG
ncbi:carbohydrate ABC transporter permease [Candidatus Atribacteria bacterium HGW-Atribacteria-1]|nr:MAG: carbohydrate ABC transporter permease [Candidatus Atribacteria bacterium HGW-Atribacteria-1]